MCSIEEGKLCLLREKKELPAISVGRDGKRVIGFLSELSLFVN